MMVIMIGNENRSYSSIISSLATVAGALIALLLPLIFLTNTTEFFTLPKQILVVAGAFILLTLYCIKSLAERKIIFVKNPLNLPVFIFAVVITVSSYISPSSLSSVPQVIPVAAAAIIYFALVNLISDKQSFRIILSSLIIGAVISSVITVLASFKIYLLPFEQTRNEFFNTFGSPVQMIGFLTPLIIFTVASVLLRYRRKGKDVLKKAPNIFYGLSFVVFTITLVVIFYHIAVSTDKPILLPFEHGFQLSLAQISQNEQRLLPSFLFGSGYGTFSTVFTRFHLPSFNNLSSWGLTFSFSSSYALELIATTGILGFLSFIYIMVKFVRSHSGFAIRPLFLSSAAVLLLTFVIPFSFSLVALTFLLLALYILNLKVGSTTKSVEEVNLSIVADGNIFKVQDAGSRKGNLILPVVLTFASGAVIAYVLFFLLSSNGLSPKGLYHYVVADMAFAKSLQPQVLISGDQTYALQVQAIQTYPYRADFYRIFSQVNLALATNLVNSQKDAPTVTEEVQQAIIQQLQQAINSSRQAVIFERESSLNWRNLGQVYRNLIGVGDNAEQFAIASYNQAIALEPNNPALRIELGGIYYQLNELDLAQNQFATAAGLKPNYANAYYNLGHSLESKGDLAQALQQYLIVKQLVQNDKANLDIISAEIDVLQKKISNASEIEKKVDENIQPSDETNLNLQEGTQPFPERDPREEIPGPPPLDGEEEEEENETSPTPSS